MILNAEKWNLVGSKWPQVYSCQILGESINFVWACDKAIIPMRDPGHSYVGSPSRLRC